MTATDPEAAAIHAAILREPGEDLHRLALADRLDELGEPERARHIRVSIECGVGGENGWVHQPHVHHKTHKPLFRVPGLKVDQYQYRRGFVADVRLSAAALLGGPCSVCYGRGTFCSGPCHGNPDYRTPGLAKALFSAHPITRVVLTDRKPGGAHGKANRVGWYFIVGGNHAYEMPYDLPEHLIRFAGPGDGMWRVFDSEADANAALSSWLVAFGRSLAGLPTLPAEVPDTRA